MRSSATRSPAGWRPARWRPASPTSCSTELGDRVGYTVRFTDQVSDRTQIKLMTDGILLAELQRDRLLRRYDTLIIDEAHERSLNIDFLLGYLTGLLPRRPDLKLIVTSATIDTQRFADHFGAPVVEVSGRTYPVEMRYRPLERDQVDGIRAAVDELRREGPGDILVFLSGEREIRDAATALTDEKLADTEILPLYARLSAAEQQRAFRPHRGRRIVLATNVAETSITVPGVRYVVDPGTARISRYSRRTKVQRLPIEPVSQASADQRAGRCGRVAPGHLHPALRRGRLRRPARVHRARDPPHQPGLGHPPDGGAAAGRDRVVPVRRPARRPRHPRRGRPAGRAGCHASRSHADEDRAPARPAADRPPLRPHDPRGRRAGLRARGRDRGGRTVDPGRPRASDRPRGRGRTSSTPVSPTPTPT